MINILGVDNFYPFRKNRNMNTWNYMLYTCLLDTSLNLAWQGITHVCIVTLWDLLYNIMDFVFVCDVANGKDGGRFSGRIVDSDMHDVGRFLNRILGLPPDIQNRYALDD